LIIKPFEASDLIALIQKLEKKLAPVKPLPTAFEGEDETPAYEKTVKLDLREFRDASYDQWKTTAEEHTDEDVPKKPAPLSNEMASSPAFMDSMDEVPQVPRTTQVLEKGQTVAFEAPVVPEYASTIQLPPPKPVAGASVPDWAVPVSQPAAEIPPAEEMTVAPAEDVDAPSRETGVGKLLSKAKTWFGGSATEEEEQAAPAHETAATSMKGDTKAMAPAHETVATSMKGDTKAMDPAEMAPPPPEFAAAATPDWAAAPATEAAPDIPAVEPHVEAASAHDAVEIEHTMAPQGMEVAHVIDPALDTSMHRESHADVSVPIDPALDTSMHHDASEVASVGVDPALVTDPTEMASAFPTNFGVAGATIDPVGIAADVPGLYDNDHIDAAPAEVGAEVVAPEAASESVAETVAAEPIAEATPAQNEEPAAGWRAEEHHLEDHEHGIRLEHEMAKHYAAQAPVAESDAAAPPSEVTPIIPGAGAQTNAPDMQFAAAMAAAVGAEMPAGLGDGTTAMDPEMLARIVQRVTERMRPSLIAEITKELISEQQKAKK
jgi:hypothetical protein